MMAALVTSPFSYAKDEDKGEMSQAAIMAVDAPIFSWLKAGSSTENQVIQKLKEGGLVLNDGVSAITGGKLINGVNYSSKPVFNIEGLKIVSLSFSGKDKKDGQEGKLDTAILMIEKGFNDKNFITFKDGFRKKYAIYGKAHTIRDKDSEASDVYYVYDLNKYVIELSMPQQGTYFQLTSTSKKSHKLMRTKDGTAHLFKDVW